MATPQTETVIGYPEACSFVINFSIPDFTSLKAHDTGIGSDMVAMCGAFWCLKVYPLCESRSGELWTTACLCRAAEGLYSLAVHKVKFLITVMDYASTASNGITRETSRHITGDRIFEAGRCGGGLTFVKHSEIWGPNPTMILGNDTLKLRAEVRCLLLTDETKNQSALAGSLQERIQSIFTLDFGRDFVLVSSDGTELPVHKVFLIAASPVFRNMFESDMEECRTGRCSISDVSTDTLDALLKYVYYGGLKYPKEMTKDLLMAADKYELLLLKEHCECTLVSGIEMENVAGLLTLADKVEVPRLKKAALDYLAKNCAMALTSGSIDDIFKTGDSDFIKEVVAAMTKVDLTA